MLRRFSAAFFSLVACAWLAPLHAAERPKLVVAILVDQLRYDYLERFHDQFGEGGFKLLTDRGTFMTFARYDYCPTITAPGHASFLSGSTPAMHGIIGNDWFDKASGQSIYCCRDASVKGVGTDAPAGQMSPRNFIGATFADQLRLHYRSKVIGISTKDRGAIFPSGKKPAGAYWFEPASGNFVTSTYYRADLPEWVAKFNARKRPQEFIGQTWDRLLKPEAYPGADDAPGEGLFPGEKTPTFPHTMTATGKGGYDNLNSSPFGNQLLAEFAQAAIEGEQLGRGPQPDLLTVSFSSVDYVGHRFGPYSHEVQDMVLRLDRQLAELFSYLDQKIGLANVAMVLTADHGVAPTPEYAAEQGLDGQRTDEMTLLLDLMGKLNERFGEGAYLLQRRLFNGHLYLNHEALRTQKIEAEEVAKFVREWALATGKFHAAYTRDELLSGRAAGPFGRWMVNGYNAERGGDVVLIYKPFVMNWPGKSGTTHGSPFSYDTHVPVLFYGSAFKPGRYPEEFYITDIVPTLSSALHMDNPPGCMGKPCGAILIAP